MDLDVPVELKKFHSIFKKLAYSYDWSVIFDDFLEYILLYHNVDSTLKWDFKYSEDEIKLFWDLYCEWIKVMDSQLDETRQWYDLFGTYYMAVIVSNMSQKWQGQFFTPDNVCDLMAEMNLTLNNKPGMTVNDPSCGSGRCLLAVHVRAPGSYHVAMDLDRTCALMTIANFLLHGVVGEVIWMNSLTLEFYGAWKVNEMLNNGMPLPHVRKAEKFELYNFKVPMQVKVENEVKPVEVTLDSFMEVGK